jgi:GNAT superfamily N-acetyltransferase
VPSVARKQFSGSIWRNRHSSPPARQGQGTGRALAEYTLDWCRQAGFASIQFNAVVETNAAAVHLWQSLGFQIIGTVPASFDHPEHGLAGMHVMFRYL